MASNPALSRTQRKLERLELEHLRQHCAALQERVEQLESDLALTSNSLDFWQRDAMLSHEALQDENFATHRAIGITKTGEVMVVRMDE
jgi:hypothetical protein